MPLIFVEGLPGSGKTTTTQWIVDTLCRFGRDARGALERDTTHPLHAFWTWGDGYRENEQVEEPFEAEKFTRRIIDRVKLLVQTLQGQEQILVIEAYPFQAAVRNHLRMGASRGDIERCYQEFQSAVNSLASLLIYLDVENMEARFEQIVRERGVGFHDLLIGSVVKAPYGRSRSLSGWAGMIHFYREYDALVQEFLAEWRGSLLKLSPEQESWPCVRRRILAALQLGHMS
jgi:thymidylate kinase